MESKICTNTELVETDRQFVYSPDSKDVGAWGGVRARSNKKEKEGLFPMLINKTRRDASKASPSDIPLQLESVERVSRRRQRCEDEGIEITNRRGRVAVSGPSAKREG